MSTCRLTDPIPDKVRNALPEPARSILVDRAAVTMGQAAEVLFELQGDLQRARDQILGLLSDEARAVMNTKTEARGSMGLLPPEEMPPSATKARGEVPLPGLGMEHNDG